MSRGGGGSEMWLVLPGAQALGLIRSQEHVWGGHGALIRREQLCQSLSRDSPAAASQRNETIEKLRDVYGRPFLR